MSADEKRINELLYAYWDNMRGSRPYPSESEIDPDELEEIWDSVFLVQLKPGDQVGFRYAYLGNSLLEAYGEDDTDSKILEQLISPDSPPLVKKFQEVEKAGQPVVDEGEFKNRKNMLVKYRSVMLPLGSKSRVEFIIGGMKWKSF